MRGRELTCGETERERVSEKQSVGGEGDSIDTKIRTFA
jgi:hypothetical protein